MRAQSQRGEAAGEGGAQPHGAASAGVSPSGPQEVTEERHRTGSAESPAGRGPWWLGRDKSRGREMRQEVTKHSQVRNGKARARAAAGAMDKRPETPSELTGGARLGKDQGKTLNPESRALSCVPFHLLSAAAIPPHPPPPPPGKPFSARTVLPGLSDHPAALPAPHPVPTHTPTLGRLPSLTVRTTWHARPGVETPPSGSFIQMNTTNTQLYITQRRKQARLMSPGVGLDGLRCC